jgi:hypothetical protein
MLNKISDPQTKFEIGTFTPENDGVDRKARSNERRAARFPATPLVVIVNRPSGVRSIKNELILSSLFV